MSESRQRLAVRPAVARLHRQVLHRLEARHLLAVHRAQNRVVGRLSQSLRVIVPVDEASVDAVGDEFGDAAGARDNDRHAAAQRLGGGHEEAFASAVAQQHVGALEPVAVAERVKVERPQVQSVLHLQVDGQLDELLHRLGLHAPGVRVAAGLGAGPGAHHNARVKLQQVRQAQQPLALQRPAHPRDDDAVLAAPAFHHRQLGHRRRQDARHGMPALLDPAAKAVEHLLRHAGDRQPAKFAIGPGDVAPAFVVPRVQDERRWTLGQSRKLAVAEHPARGVVRCLRGHGANGEAAP